MSENLTLSDVLFAGAVPVQRRHLPGVQLLSEQQELHGDQDRLRLHSAAGDHRGLRHAVARRGQAAPEGQRASRESCMKIFLLLSPLHCSRLMAISSKHVTVFSFFSYAQICEQFGLCNRLDFFIHLNKAFYCVRTIMQDTKSNFVQYARTVCLIFVLR